MLEWLLRGVQVILVLSFKDQAQQIATRICSCLMVFLSKNILQAYMKLQGHFIITKFDHLPPQMCIEH